MQKEEMADIIIELKKATILINSKTTASGIANDLNNKRYPYFYHSYNPDNAFIAVPPDWLARLAEQAGEIEFAEKVKQNIETVKGAKGVIIELIKEKTRKRLEEKANK